MKKSVYLAFYHSQSFNYMCLFGVFTFTIVLFRTKGKEKGTGSWAEDWPSPHFFGELNGNGRERQIDQQLPHNSIQY
jgi:hypothetical protein